MKTLDKKVVVITGAGSGIGRALAIDLAGRGAVLALSDWDQDGLRATEPLVEERGALSVRGDVLDVRDREAVHAYAASVAADLGRVDVLVNNAGVALHGDFEEASHEDFRWVIDVDLWGVVHGTEAFLPHLIASGDGHLVNMSSLFGLVGVPGQTAYNAAKFAVRGFSEALRQEMILAGHPVGVTSVHPGGIRTAIVRNARTTRSHDPAQLALDFEARLARTTPERAAERIVDGILRNKARVLIGADAHLIDLASRLLGPAYLGLAARVARRMTR